MPYAFKVARIEPENNVELILGAFSKLPKKKLVIVGNWENSNYGKRLKAIFSKNDNIHLLDPIYNQKELDKLRSNCYIYVHGHSAGGTNPSLIEAMYLGLPIMAFDVSYNRSTTENQALFFESEENLMTLLNNTSLLQLKYVEKQLQSIAFRRYTWRAISNKYYALLEAFNYEYKKPELKPIATVISYSKLLKSGHAHLSNSRLFFESKLNQ